MPIQSAKNLDVKNCKRYTELIDNLPKIEDRVKESPDHPTFLKNSLTQNCDQQFQSCPSYAQKQCHRNCLLVIFHNQTHDPEHYLPVCRGLTLVL